MKIWTYAANSHYKTASYILDEAPWFIFFLENLTMIICDALHEVPIPFGKTIKVRINNFFCSNELITLDEYYGSIGGLFHVFICSRITTWCFKKIKTKIIDTDYEELKKEKFDESPELFQEDLL